ncbi:hypothetical protein Clacol_008414 [Clathrus columnatus]|uniref:SEP-domain-containing protein n=1 Tax=Clathrus columnatus TaxID=1419009 RepID=A0AAV5AN64_9AGAM|nr:hypothetical protein Clacol_008414 [Clathrus columnatus]
MSDPNNPSNNDDQHGTYTLGGGRVEPLPTAWGRSNQQSGTGRTGRIGATSAFGSSSTDCKTDVINDRNTSSSNSRFATLRDLSGSSATPLGGGSGPPMGGHMSDDDDDDGPEGNDNDGGENWYAGGERSGLSVENPERRSGPHVVRDILRKAAEAATPPQAAATSGGSFRGSGYKLGSDEVESSIVPDMSAQTNESGDDQQTATRYITFWRDGFSVEDGPLMRYDEPGNAQLLNEINAGHAPPQFLNVDVGQPVELRVTRRLNEDYIPPPKRPLAAFEGQGHRLGSIVPETASAEPSIPGAFPTSSTSSRVESTQMKFEVDQTLPTTSVQVRLADGTRLVARMNLHHTVGDIRNFINASRPGSSLTPYTIQTPFPVRILDDNTLTIEKAGLKNSVVVQRMT